MSSTEKKIDLEKKLNVMTDDNPQTASNDGVIEQGSPTMVSEKLKDHDHEPTPVLANHSESQPCKRVNQMWDFVEDLDDNGMFLCKICMDILIEPHLITCCGECICKKCIDSHLLRVSAVTDKKKSCPFCRKDDFKLIENSDLKKSINRQKVFCLYRKSGCMWSGKLQEGESHLHECMFCPVDCPNKCECGKIERHSLRKHFAECPQQIMECLFAPIGCKTGYPLLRKEVKVHSNQDIHQHLILLAKSSLTMLDEFDTTITALHLSQNEVVKEMSDKICSKKQELTKLEHTIKSLETELLDLQHRIDAMKQVEGANRARYTAKLNSRCNEAMGLKDVCQMTLAKLQAMPVPPANYASCPPVTFTVDHFSVRKTHDEEWISPPFYTHFGGYKMCLSIFPNGIQEAQGNHVSVYLHMMSGEFDDHLKWPFPGALVNISALSQQNPALRKLAGSRGNIGANIGLLTRDARECRYRVCDGTYSPGHGRRRYISHQYLNQYLTKDSFKIMIFNVQFL